MTKMKKWFLGLAAVSVLVAGCGEDKVKEPEVPQMPEVEILTPEQLEVGDVTLESTVIIGGKPADDAAVQFELWESGHREDGVMLDGDAKGDGKYEATAPVDRDGVYYMFAHTTVEGIHTMPKKKLIVGEPDMDQVVEEDPNENNEMR